jgi:hypothetical protein
MSARIPRRSIVNQILCLVITTLGLMAALWVSAPLVRYALVGKPHILVEGMPDMLHLDQRFHIKINAQTETREYSHKNLRFYSDKVSILYDITRGETDITETVTVHCVDTYGMIFTLVNGRLICLERLGGLVRRNELTEPEDKSLMRFMAMLRQRLQRA